MISGKKFVFITIFLIAFISGGDTVFAQNNTYTIDLTRGKLWHSFYISQECEPMADWGRKTYGMDWPGFRTEEIKQNIGGSNSYLVAGGFFITAKTQ